MIQIGANSAHHEIALPGPTTSTVTLSWSVATDRGYHRSSNEDSVIAKAPIFAVADGMGGHAAGDIASAAVVTRLAELTDPLVRSRDDITNALRLAVKDIMSFRGETDSTTGTTVSGLALTMVDNELCWLVFNIGDSRVYTYAERSLQQITVDHSVVQLLVDTGAISPSEAHTHPNSNVITRAVGLNEDPVPDFSLIPVVEGSRFLVCSDGLTKELTDYGIGWFLSKDPLANDAVSELMQTALDNGGRDNVTLIVVDVERAPASARESARFACA